MSDSNSKDVNGFACLEKELQLFERNYNGFFYWQHIRFFVCESLYGNRTNNEQQVRELHKRSIGDYFLEIINALAESIRLEFKIRSKKKYDLIFLREGILKDRFFDTWRLPEDISVIDFRSIQYNKEQKDGFLFLEWPRLKCEIENKIRRKLHNIKVDDQEKRFLHELEKRLLNDYGQSIAADEMEMLIYWYEIVDRHYSKYYAKIFEATKCSAMVCTCYYSDYLRPAHRVAKEKKIPVIELQHGVINNHEEYWFEDTRGINNYTPDYLLTFGEIHNSWVKLVEGKNSVAIGYPFQEKSLQSLRNISTNEKEIVVYPESYTRFEETIDRFINEISSKGYHVIIKIHPIESKNVGVYYPLLSKNPNAEIVTSQKEGIYYWLKRAKHHIMASTTVGLEAVVFEHSNVCIATNITHDQVQCLLDWGIARGFSTSEELVNLILEPIDLKTKEAKRIRRELWSENASENMTAFFRDLKQNGWKV